MREAEGDALVALVVAPRTPRGKLEQVAAALARHPAVRGVVAIENDRRDGAIVPSGSSAQVLLGHGSVVEHVAGVAVEVGAGEFLQVNRAQAAALYARVAELAEARPGLARPICSRGWAASGCTWRARAPRSPPSSWIRRRWRSCARGAAGGAAARGDRRRRGRAAGAGARGARRRRRRRGREPAAQGAVRRGRALLAGLGAPTVIYVSCGPESLARDLTALGAAGWLPDAVEPYRPDAGHRADRDGRAAAPGAGRERAARRRTAAPRWRRAEQRDPPDLPRGGYGQSSVTRRIRVAASTFGSFV